MYIYIYSSDQVSTVYPTPLLQITLGGKKKEGKKLRKRNV